MIGMLLAAASIAATPACRSATPTYYPPERVYRTMRIKGVTVRMTEDRPGRTVMTCDQPYRVDGRVSFYRDLPPRPPKEK